MSDNRTYDRRSNEKSNWRCGDKANYECSYENGRGSNELNYGFSQNQGGIAPNIEFSDIIRGNSKPYYGFSDRNDTGSNAPDYGFHQNQDRNSANYGLSDQNERGNDGSNYEFHQIQSSNTPCGISLGNDIESNETNIGLNQYISNALNDGLSDRNDLRGYVSDYGSNQNQGSNKTNYGCSNRSDRERGASNYGFNQNRSSNAADFVSNLIRGNTIPKHGSNYGFNQNQGSNETSYRCSNRNDRERDASNYGFNQNRSSNATDFVSNLTRRNTVPKHGSNQNQCSNKANYRLSDQNNQSKNQRSNINETATSDFEKFSEGLIKVLGNACKLFNTGSSSNKKATDEGCSKSYKNSFRVEGTFTTRILGPNKKKDLTRPLPKGFKLTKKERKLLIEQASKRKLANVGVEICELKDNALIRMANADINKVHALWLNEIPRRILRKEVAELLPHTDVTKISAIGLRTIMRRDPNYRPPEGKDWQVEARQRSLRLQKKNPEKPTLSERELRKRNKGIREAIKVLQSVSAEKKGKQENVKLKDDKLENDEAEEAKPIKGLLNPVKRIMTPSTENFPGLRAYKKKYNLGSFKERHNMYKANKSLNYNDIVVVAYLHCLMFQIIPEARFDSLQFCEYALGHQNVIKLLRYQVRKLLSKKFRKIKMRKKQYLHAHKNDFLLETAEFFSDKKDILRLDLVNKCIDVLSANEFPADLIPTPCDYLRDPSVTPSPKELTDEFQCLFLYRMFQSLGYFVPKLKTPSTTFEFHRYYNVIPPVLVEYVRSFDTYVSDSPYVEDKLLLKPGDRFIFPDSIACHFKKKPGFGYLRNHVLWKLYRQLKVDNAQVETKIFHVIPTGAKSTGELLRDFGNVILFSDEMLSVTKYILIEHTPFIALSRQEKIDLFDTDVKKIYRQVFEILQKNWSLHDVFAKIGPLESGNIETIHVDGERANECAQPKKGKFETMDENEIEDSGYLNEGDNAAGQAQAQDVMIEAMAVNEENADMNEVDSVAGQTLQIETIEVNEGNVDENQVENAAGQTQETMDVNEGNVDENQVENAAGQAQEAMNVNERNVDENQVENAARQAQETMDVNEGDAVDNAGQQQDVKIERKKNEDTADRNECAKSGLPEN